MNNLDRYKVFYYVAKWKSITMAANELKLSQPAVSQSIKLLEQSLNCSLFIRSKSGTFLTNEGQLLYDYISRGYALILQGEKKLKDSLNLENGEVIVGVNDIAMKLFLLKEIPKFKKLYPRIKISIVELSSMELLQNLKQHSVDFVLVTSPIKNVTEYDVYPLLEIQDVFITSKENKNIPTSFQDLSKHSLIQLAKPSTTRMAMDTFLAQQNIFLHPDYQLPNLTQVHQLVAENLGIGCSIREVVEFENNDIIQEIKLPKLPKKRYLCLVKEKNGYLSNTANKLYDFLYQYVITQNIGGKL